MHFVLCLKAHIIRYPLGSWKRIAHRQLFCSRQCIWSNICTVGFLWNASGRENAQHALANIKGQGVSATAAAIACILD